MSNFLVAVIAGTVLLGIMIFLHEWGHFIAAKMSGVRVDVFSLGFGTRLWGFKRGDTDYRLSALPFGGYVRMAGDNPLEERSGAAYEYLSKSRWARVFIACAGPAMNIILAFVIFLGIYLFKGIPSPSYLHEPASVAAVPQEATLTGIQAGDRIVSFNGVATPLWGEVDDQLGKLKPGDSVALAVERDGAKQALTAKVPGKLDSSLLVGYPPVPAIADEIGIGTPAERAGLKPGDVFVAVDGQPVATWMQLVEAVHDSDGHTLQFTVLRGEKKLTLSVTPMHTMDPSGDEVWQVGIAPKTGEDFEKQSLPESVKDATGATIGGCRQILDVLGGLFTGKVAMRDLSSVVGIARVAGRAAKRGPMDFVLLMAIISLNLGLLNLLPIPILDGGHVLLLAIEGTLRRDLSVAFKERFVQVGLVFLLGVFAFVMYSDILKLIQSH